jgi:hypothetical protein
MLGNRHREARSAAAIQADARRFGDRARHIDVLDCRTRIRSLAMTTWSWLWSERNML